MDNYIGKRLDGRYAVEQLVGEGGMANVYKATDLLEERTVAVKILKDEFRGNPELVRRFKNESRAISVLSQQNIVKVFDVSVSDKVQYIVMEYIEGITLKEYIEQRGEPLTYKESIIFISQVLRALQHAHDKGIVHRDIKPQNIMLTSEGTVKVMDFGIARLARSDIHTDGEQAIGSVHYISPEQAQGAATDPRADIYSAGIMLYEMLSGKLPFESDNAVSIAIKQISDDAEPLCKVNPSVPEGLGGITMRAMAKDPKNRYQTALEMLRDIEEFKRNPSVKFEYDYLMSEEPARYIEKVANNKANGKKPAAAPAKNTNGAKGKRKPKRKKRHSILVPVVAGITIAVVAVCAFLSWRIFQESGNYLFVNLEEIELPNMVGMTVDDIEQLKKQSDYSNLRFMEYEYEYNEELPPNTVIAQSPASPDGTMMVKENQRVYLTVNREAESITMPDLSGMTRREAQDYVLELGMRPHIVVVENDTATPGKVFDTDPASGATVEASSSSVIRIYIASKSVEYLRAVPNLIGMSLSEATQALMAADLELGYVKYEYSDQPEDMVLEQSPEGGTSRSIGSMVSVTVSQGPEPEPEPEVPAYVAIMPNFVGKTWAEASAFANENGLIAYPRGGSSNQTIVSQWPDEGTELPENGTFEVRFPDDNANNSTSKADDDNGDD